MSNKSRVIFVLFAALALLTGCGQRHFSEIENHGTQSNANSEAVVKPVDLSLPLFAMLPKAADGELQKPTCCACSNDGRYLVIATAGVVSPIPQSKYVLSDVPPAVSTSMLFVLNAGELTVVSKVTTPRSVTSMAFAKDGTQLFVSTGIAPPSSGSFETSVASSFGDKASEPFEVIGFEFPSMRIKARLEAPGPLFELKYASRLEQLLVTGVDQQNIGVIVSIDSSDFPDTWPTPKSGNSYRGALTELDVSHDETYALVRRHHAGVDRINLVHWRYEPAHILESLEVAILPDDIHIVTLSSGLYVNSIDQEDRPLKANETGSESLLEFDPEGNPWLHTPDFRPVSLGDFRSEHLLGMIAIERERPGAVLQLWDTDSKVRFDAMRVPVSSMKLIAVAPDRQCVFVVGDEIHRMPFPAAH
ncbi:MAG: hypothetical protein R3C18_09535 [Planctomycetaceae bacterium]